MPDFVFKANIAHFQSLLEQETDPAKRAKLQGMLAEEKAKLEEWQANRPPKAAE